MSDHPRTRTRLLIRMPKSVKILLQVKATRAGMPEDRPGRLGGISLYVLRLIYQDLGLDPDDIEDPHAEQARLMKEKYGK